MNLNNDVRDWRGNLIGFKCFQCGDIYTSGWGNTCNRCRREEERHQEILKAMKQSKA